MKKPTARNAVVRESRFAVPRLDMKPAPPPMPRPPPSDFCSSTAPISTATIMRWMTIITVCIASLPSQARKQPEKTALSALRGFREVARCYTIGPGIVTPEIVAGPGMASVVDHASRRP